MDEILTVKEVSEYLKVSRTTIWRWCNEGRLEAFKVGRGWRIHRSSVGSLTGQRLEGITAVEETTTVKDAER